MSATEYQIGDEVWVSANLKGVVSEIGKSSISGETIYVVAWWNGERWNDVLKKDVPLRTYHAWLEAKDLRPRVPLTITQQVAATDCPQPVLR